MGSRKTVEVESVKNRVNHMIENASSADARSALGFLLESVLMDTDNYHGFQFLSSEYLPADEQKDGQVLRDGYDPTKRRYF